MTKKKVKKTPAKKKSTSSIKKPAKRVLLLKRHEALEKQVQDLYRNFGKLNFKLVKDLQDIQTRINMLWEVVWAAIDYLEKNNGLTIEKLEESRKEVVGKWKAEAAVEKKKELKPGQVLCENCMFIGEEKLFADADLQCPKCKAVEIFFAPDEVKEEAEG